MRARKDLSSDPALSSGDRHPPGSPDLHAVLDPDGVDTHTLLLLFLLPEANRADIDPDTVHAVEVLSEVQTRLCRDTRVEPFEKEKLAGVLECLSEIRFGCH